MGWSDFRPERPTRSSAMAGVASVLVAGLLLPSVPATSSPPRTRAAAAVPDDPGELVSVSSSGIVAGGRLAGGRPQVSADGNRVVFLADRDFDIAADDNEATDAFVHDRSSGETLWVSINAGGAQGDQNAEDVSISNDGNSVAFAMFRGSLDSGEYCPTFNPNTDGSKRVFVKRLDSGELIEVTPPTLVGPDENNATHCPAGGTEPNPQISGDGHHVAFVSGWHYDTMEPPQDTRETHIYLKSLTIGIYERIDVTSAGTDPAGDCGSCFQSVLAGMSDDARYVLFASNASLAPNTATAGGSTFFAYLRDRVTQTTEAVSIEPDGLVSPAYAGSLIRNDSGALALSGDGRTVAFIPTVTGGGRLDLLVRDLDTGVTTRSGFGPNGKRLFTFDNPSLDRFGEVLAFYGETALEERPRVVGSFVRDLTDNETRAVMVDELYAARPGPDHGAPGIDPSISDDGATVVYRANPPPDFQNENQVFARDLTDKVRVRGKVLEGDQAGDGHSRILYGAKVELQQNGALIRPKITTGSDGRYEFRRLTPGEYELRVTLEDARYLQEGLTAAGRPLFEVRHTEGGNRPVWIEVALDLSERVTTKDVAFSEHEEDLITTGPDFTAATVSRLDDMATIFNNMAQYLDWVERNLAPLDWERPDLGLFLPIQIYTFSSTAGSNNASYNPNGTVIHISADLSPYEVRRRGGVLRGPEVEWHEFTHHLWRVNVLQQGPGVGCNGRNHHGYWNPSTCDSTSEGLAEFLPVVARSFPNGEVKVTGSEIGRPPDAYDGFLGIFLESNRLDAWGTARVNLVNQDRNLPREEFAYAALLWDLVDVAPNDTERLQVIGADNLHTSTVVTDEISIPLRALWSIIREKKILSVRSLWTELQSSAVVPATAKAVSIDLDGDGLADVAPLDVPFLMHGFHPVRLFEFSANHMHYDVGVADHLGFPGPERNRAIGRTDSLDPGDTSKGLRVRHMAERVPGAQIALDVTGPGGDEVPGASLIVNIREEGGIERTIAIPVEEQTTTLYLELPQYFEGILLEDEDLPACDEDTLAPTTTVSITASLGTKTSETEAEFDGCTYSHQIADNDDPEDPAVSFAMELPASATKTTVKPKKTKRAVVAKGRLTPGYPGAWIVIKYQRRTGGKWKTIVKKQALLGNLVDPDGNGTFHSAYKKSFKRSKTSSKCRLVAAWKGKPTHLKSKALSRFKC